MTGKRYYITRLGDWQRHAARFANSHWLALGERTAASVGDDAARAAATDTSVCELRAATPILPRRSRRRRAPRARRRRFVRSSAASARAEAHLRRRAIRARRARHPALRDNIRRRRSRRARASAPPPPRSLTLH